MTTICFYNHWHNGDVFSGKAHMWNLMTQYPGFNYVYAINSHPKTISDLRCKIMHVNDLPSYADSCLKGAHDENTIYINTWYGVYRWEVSGSEEIHANYASLHKMWQQIYQKLMELLNIQIHMEPDALSGVARTDWSCYQTHLADAFMDMCGDRKIHLFCNGDVRSEQSDVDDMHLLINGVAHENPDQVFVATKAFHTSHKNVYFTDDIFRLQNDINEIAYLSTKAHVIVGKNSGPYMFCHVKENIHNPHKKFWSLSQRPYDSYVYGCENLECDYYHSMKFTLTDLLQQFYQIQKPNLQVPGSRTMQVLT